MKTFFKVIGIVVALFVAVGLFLPTNYHVTRSITIDATPDKIHSYVGNLDKWPAWSPWEKSDPSIKITPGNTRSGIGASQSWVGDSGSGSLTFTHSSPQMGIRYDMMFNGTDPSTAEVVYTVSNDGKSTTVNWNMDGELVMPVIGGYFAMLMDSMVGPMFDDGLQRLKKAVETEA